MKPVKLAVLALGLGAGLGASMSAHAPGPVMPGPRLSLSTAALPALDPGSLRLPAGRVSDLAVARLTGGAINPGDYVCPASTPIVDWYWA